MRRFVPLVLVVGVLVFAACGSSGSKKTNAQSSGSTTTAAGGATSSTTVPNFSGSSNYKYCQLAKDVEKNGTTQDTTNIKASFTEFDKVANEFLSAAPSAIKSDAQTLVDGVRKYEDVLKKANFDFTKVNPADVQSFDDPKFQQAAARVEAYDAQVCGVGTTTTGG